MMARFDSANAAYGESYLLVTILACVLGGINPSGGFGRVGGLVIALVILQLISTACVLLNFSQFLTLALWGGILLAVAAVAAVLRDYFGFFWKASTMPRFAQQGHHRHRRGLGHRARDGAALRGSEGAILALVRHRHRGAAASTAPRAALPESRLRAASRRRRQAGRRRSADCRRAVEAFGGPRRGLQQRRRRQFRLRHRNLAGGLGPGDRDDLCAVFHGCRAAIPH